MSTSLDMYAIPSILWGFHLAVQIPRFAAIPLTGITVKCGTEIRDDAKVLGLGRLTFLIVRMSNSDREAFDVPCDTAIKCMCLQIRGR